MSYLFINLFSQRERCQLNPDEAILRLQEQFPEAIVLPGDQLTLSARRADRNLVLTNPANRVVVEKLARDAQHLGPAYAFQIPMADAPNIEGVIKRYQADFHCAVPFADEIRRRIIAFLQSLIPARMAIAVGEECNGESEAAENDTDPRGRGSDPSDDAVPVSMKGVSS